MQSTFFADLQLALAIDRFSFAMPVKNETDGTTIYIDRHLTSQRDVYGQR
jgi:hypothetical protein